MDIPKKIYAINAFSKLKKVVARLRSPFHGCPWDQIQTHTSLIPYLLEEAHEVADAIRHGNDDNLKEELGDLLLQITLHAQIADEEGRFCLEDIAEDIREKLVRRHPHVFSRPEKKSLEDVKTTWEQVKSNEKPKISSKSPLSDHLKQKIRSRSAINGAIEISKKVSKAGFEWKNIESVWEKVDAELLKLKAALKKKDLINAEEELGDVLFTLINLARWCELSPEESLAGTNKRFLDRFAYVESKLEDNLSTYSTNELKQLWERAKNDS